MTPCVSSSHRISRRGVNRLRTLFEDAGHIVEEIPGASDFGEDLRVTFVSEERRSPYVCSIQVKSGSSYWKEGSGRLPVGSHVRNWAETNVPVVGVVYQPERDEFAWTNATERLRRELIQGGEPSVLAIPGNHRLDAGSLPRFVEEITAYIARIRSLPHAVEEI